MLPERLTPQFVAYMTVTIALFTTVGVGAMAMGLDTIWAYALGFVVSMPVELIREYFQSIEEEINRQEVGA